MADHGKKKGKKPTNDMGKAETAAYDGADRAAEEFAKAASGENMGSLGKDTHS